MCLVGFALNHFEGFPLVMVANRDEYHERPTEPLHAWATDPVIYAGRDLQAGGTWMGVNARGQIAVLTNLRGHPMPSDQPPSRGDLVSGFLLSGMPAAQWLDDLSATASQYAGFNLLLSDDGRQFHLLSNAGDRCSLAAGVHAISNGRIDEAWPKADGLRTALASVQRPHDTDELRALMENTDVAPDDELPQTGVGIEFERLLAPRLILGADYGTRSTTVLTLTDDGVLSMTEFTRARDGKIIGERTLSLG